MLWVAIIEAIPVRKSTIAWRGFWRLRRESAIVGTIALQAQVVLIIEEALESIKLLISDMNNTLKRFGSSLAKLIYAKPTVRKEDLRHAIHHIPIEYSDR
jgi:hypothetical protein